MSPASGVSYVLEGMRCARSQSVSLYFLGFEFCALPEVVFRQTGILMADVLWITVHLTKFALSIEENALIGHESRQIFHILLNISAIFLGSHQEQMKTNRNPQYILSLWCFE